jgi:putative MATE family efflux protein
MLDSRHVDMLHGSLWDKILIVAIPLAITGFMQQLFNAIDIAMLGQLVSSEAMAAVGSDAPIIAMMISLFLGIAIGVNVTIASYIGKGDDRKVRKAVHTSLVLALICGSLLVILGELAVDSILYWLAVPLEISDMAGTYLRVFFLGVPTLLLYNFEAAILRSIGDTRTALAALFIGGVIKVLLNMLFLMVFHFSVLGVAISTAISPCISAIFLLIYLKRSDLNIRVRFDEIGINGEVLKHMLYIGVPAGIQGMVFALSNVVVQTALNSLGTDVLAATAASFNLEFLGVIVFSSFTQVTSTFVSQNYGARQLDRCKRVTKICMFQAVLATIISSGLVMVFQVPLLKVFNADETILSYGYIRLLYICLPCFIQTILEILAGAMRGYGNSISPAIISLVGICGTRILYVLTIFPKSPTLETLVQVFPISWLVTVLFMAIAYNRYMKTLKEF